MFSDRDPMPTGDRPWHAYHYGYIRGVAGFGAFAAGFGIGFVLNTWLLGDLIPSAVTGLIGGALMTVWHMRSLARHNKRLVQDDAERTAAQWAAKEAEKQRQIAEMKRSGQGYWKSDQEQ